MSESDDKGEEDEERQAGNRNLSIITPRVTVVEEGGGGLRFSPRLVWHESLQEWRVSGESASKVQVTCLYIGKN